MFDRALVMYIYSETPLHPGSGATINGIADLPIQRERHTEFPIIQASSIKGVLRNSAKEVGINNGNRDLIFGEQERIGGVSVTDARILAFPVRSLKGIFGWITCPLVLERFKRDLELAGKAVDFSVSLPSEDGKALVPANCNLVMDGNIYLEDVKLEAESNEDVTKIADILSNCIHEGKEYEQTREKIKRDLVIVSNDIFRDFTVMTIEIATRIKIDQNSGTVESGGLWSEEHLPTDTLMYFLVLIPGRTNNLSAEDVEQKLRNFEGKILQMGGDETIGRGFTRLKVD